MPRPIEEPLIFYNALADRTLRRGDAELAQITFLTFSACEALTKTGMTVLVPGVTIKNSYILRQDPDGIEFYPAGGYPLFQPTRQITIVDWKDFPPKNRPLASLTYVIGTYDDGQHRKLAELTHGEIEAGVFKFLQINAVNFLMNNRLEEENLDEE